MSAAQTWRVVLAPRTPDGAAEERQLTVVWVERFGGTWTCGGHGYHRSPRRAAMMAAFTLDYDVAEILAPGEPTQAETIAGRTTPPTDEEMRAHDVAGGSWLVWWGRESYTIAPAWLPYRRPGYRLKPWDLALRWIALDAEGRPCAWPVASEGGAS